MPVYWHPYGAWSSFVFLQPVLVLFYFFLSKWWSIKSALFCFSSQSFFLQFFAHIFQVMLTAGLRDSFDTNMGPTGRYTTQQRIKIIKAYFATKSDILTQRQCRRSFSRNNVPDGRTIQRLVAKLSEDRKCGSRPQRPTSFTIRHNSWEYSEFTGTPWGIPQKTNTLSIKRYWHFQNISFKDPPWWP